MPARQSWVARQNPPRAAKDPAGASKDSALATANLIVTTRTEGARDPPPAARAFQSGMQLPDAADGAAKEPGRERRSDSPTAASGNSKPEAGASHAILSRRESEERAPVPNRLSRRTA